MGLELFVGLVPLLKDMAPEVASKIKDILLAWLTKYQERLENDYPELKHEIEQVLAAGDLHALSVLAVRLYERVGPNAPRQPGDQARYQDPVHPSGPAVVGGDAPAVSGASGTPG